MHYKIALLRRSQPPLIVLLFDFSAGRDLTDYGQPMLTAVE
jgi:hypothetical protein